MLWLIGGCLYAIWNLQIKGSQFASFSFGNHIVFLWNSCITFVTSRKLSTHFIQVEGRKIWLFLNNRKWENKRFFFLPGTSVPSKTFLEKRQVLLMHALIISPIFMIWVVLFICICTSRRPLMDSVSDEGKTAELGNIDELRIAPAKW